MPKPGSSLILNNCADSSGQCYYVNPAGYPNKVVGRSSYTSPLPITWTVNASGSLVVEYAQVGNAGQLFNYSSGSFISFSSGLCISVAHAQLGFLLFMSPCNGDVTQQFVYNSTDDGHVHAVNMETGLCIDSAP